MELVKQFSVSLVNKPGRVAAVLTALNKEKLVLRAFVVMAIGGRGILRMVPDDPQRAAEALVAINVKFDATSVLMVDVPSHSGGLPKICQRLAGEHLNIDYVYGSQHSGGNRGGALEVVKVNDLAKAQRVLNDSSASSGLRANKQPRRRPTHAR